MNKGIYGFVSTQTAKLSDDSKSSARATKAKLRRAAGKTAGECPEVWDSVLFELPEVLQDNQRALNSIHLAMTLFAIHGRHVAGMGLGAAMKRLAPPGDEASKSKKRRFDAAITSSGYKELANHLRGLVQLFKQADIGLDFARLAEDVYCFLADSDSKIKVTLKWGKDYYHFNKTENETKETSDND
jgi:CRISPR system Cascade subunit CasB